MNSKIKFKEGTLSVLFGCHSFIHSFIVLVAWIKLYRKFPKPWQIVCIFIHDIGHWGLDYLSYLDDKKNHWKLGAKIAGKLFGKNGYDFCAGHCTYSNLPKSDLYKADKYSWYIAPKLWCWWTTLIEPKLKDGSSSSWSAVLEFKKNVSISIESGKYISTHNFYIERQKK